MKRLDVTILSETGEKAELLARFAGWPHRMVWGIALRIGEPLLDGMLARAAGAPGADDYLSSLREAPTENGFTVRGYARVPDAEYERAWCEVYPRTDGDVVQRKLDVETDPGFADLSSIGGCADIAERTSQPISVVRGAALDVGVASIDEVLAGAEVGYAEYQKQGRRDLVGPLAVAFPLLFIHKHHRTK